MPRDRDLPRTNPPRVDQNVSDPPAEVPCNRCGRRVGTGEPDGFLARTGLCFWCAYIDSQG